nr:unnamed protein product [Callosobruchus analis]
MEQPDRINISSQFFETEDTNLDDRFLFQSKEQFDSESIGIETQGYDQAKVTEHDEPDLSM